MKFYASQDFKKDFNKLKRKKNKYGCVPNSLFEILYNKSNQELECSGDLLMKLGNDGAVVKKRAKTCGNNGKSGGFRLITMILTQRKVAILLMVYPKWGSDSVECAKKSEWKERIEAFNIEHKNKNSIKVTIDNNKKVIKL